jgi:hypothetical protein
MRDRIVSAGTDSIGLEKKLIRRLLAETPLKLQEKYATFLDYNKISDA